MPQLLGLIFDLDGTLVDSAVELQKILNKLLPMQGRRELSLDEVKSMTGDGLFPMLKKAFAATGRSLSPPEADKIFSDFITLYQVQKSSPEMLYPQAQDTLCSFRENGVKIGLCTTQSLPAVSR